MMTSTNTTIPIPPSHAMRLRQKRILYGRLSMPCGRVVPFHSGRAESTTEAPVVVSPEAVSKRASCGYMWATIRNGSEPNSSAASQPNATVANPSRTPVFPALPRRFRVSRIPVKPTATAAAAQNENSASVDGESFMSHPTGTHPNIAKPM